MHVFSLPNRFLLEGMFEAERNNYKANLACHGLAVLISAV